MRAPINSVKHYVQFSNATLATGASITQVLVNAVVAPATASTASVKEGSIIKAVFIEKWLVGDSGVDGTPSQFVLTVEKKRDAEPDMTAAQSNTLAAYPNKKNILYTTMGIITNSKNGGPTAPVLRSWIKIPKGKQRFGLGDELVVNIAAIVTIRHCGFSTYKEYT